MASGSSGRQWAIEYAPGKGAAFPTSSVIGAPVLGNQYGAIPWQTSAVASSVKNVAIPAGAAGASLQRTVTSVLTAFPNPITLKSTDAGVVIAQAFLAANEPAVLVGMPYVTLTFGSGSILNTPGTGNATFVLQPGASYANPVLSATLTVFYLTTLLLPITMPVTLQAVLYGISGS